MKPNKIQALMKMAKEQAKLSKDKNTQVGAIVIDQEGGTLLSGYNGFVRGAPDSTLPDSGEKKREYMTHAEENILCRAARKGIALDNTILVCTLSPCKKCTRLLYQAGITTIYFEQKYKDFEANLTMKDLVVKLYQVDNYYKLTLSQKA